VQTGLSNKALLKGTTMRKIYAATLTLGLSLLTASIASAQPAAKGDNKVKVYDFSGDTIEGDLVKPEGTDLNARDFAKHSSLITIRKDFIPEIIKSAEDL